MEKDIVSRLRMFMDNEARSCSMDHGCITPLYVYRMWGGVVALEEISAAMSEIKKADVYSASHCLNHHLSKLERGVQGHSRRSGRRLTVYEKLDNIQISKKL